MKLTLTVIASQPGNAPCGASRAVERDQLTIGRGAGCDWILPDPLNHLSKRHCLIVAAASEAGFVVTDTSTNGVFINEASEPLGNGKSAALQDGDRIALGDYVLEARIAAAEQSSRRSLPANEEDDPFGIADLLVGRTPQAPAAVSPPASVDAPFPPPRPADRLEADRNPVIPDDLAWLNEGPADEPGGMMPPRADRRNAIPDHVPAQNAAFMPPRVESAAIPEDWLNDDVAPLPAARAEGPPAAELLAAFLTGAGMAPDALRGQDGAAVMRAVGKAYRAAVLGLAEILRTRALIKSEFRIEQTKIGAVGNNPLKFLDDPEEIVRAMIGAPTPGFQEARAALGDGMRDLKAHQLAMVAAIQTALARLLTQLDPEALKSRLESRPLLEAVLPGARKARYWEAFEESYKSIAAELEEDFNGVFGKAFAEAYEDELRRS
jgi:type VI secretion system FHA domain protein